MAKLLKPFRLSADAIRLFPRDTLKDQVLLGLVCVCVCMFVVLVFSFLDGIKPVCALSRFFSGGDFSGSEDSGRSMWRDSFI